MPTDLGLARETESGWEMVNVDDGLSTNDISAVFQDREGSIWLGLLGSGLARWLGYNEWQNWSDRQGLSRSSVWSIARDAGGTLWVGTQFGLNYGQMQNGRLVWKPKPIPGGDMIRSLASGMDGSMWIGAGTGGLTQMDPRTGQSRQFGEREGLENTEIFHVMVDHRGHVWASTRRGLYQTTQPARMGSPVLFERMLPEGTTAGEAFVMTVEDRTGQIWTAGDLGLARLTGKRWRRFTTADGLKADMIAQLAADDDGSVWIGYRDAFGITHLSFNGDAPRLEHFAAGSGLHSDKSIFLGFDRRGWLWAGTDHGVDVFDHVRWRHFGRSDGLIWDDCNTNAFMAGEDGSIWIGTSRGLSRFQPQSAALPNVPAPVVFTSVKFGDTPMDPFRRSGGPLEQALAPGALRGADLHPGIERAVSLSPVDGHPMAGDHPT